jgi:hypothetical protein
MRHKTTQDLFSYWDALRRGRRAPRRLDIQPSEIASILPDAFILERLDASMFRFRLAGTRMCSRLDSDLRGSNFLDRWSLADRSMLEHHLAEITDQARAGVLTFEAAAPGGKCRTFEILILPLLHTGSAVDRLLCSLSALDDDPEEGRLGPFRLLAAEAVWPEGRAPAPTADEPASRQLPLHAHIRNARIVRHDRRQFRVYDGGLGKPQAE